MLSGERYRRNHEDFPRWHEAAPRDDHKRCVASILYPQNAGLIYEPMEGRTHAYQATGFTGVYPHFHRGTRPSSLLPEFLVHSVIKTEATRSATSNYLANVQRRARYYPHSGLVYRHIVFVLSSVIILVFGFRLRPSPGTIAIGVLKINQD